MGCSGLGLVWWWLITVLGNGAVVFVAEWDVVLVGGSGVLGGAVMVAGSVGGVIVVFVGWGDWVVGIELLGVVNFGRGAGYVADGNEGCEGKKPKLRPEKYCGGRGIFR